MNTYGFPRSLRLLKPEEFQQVFATSEFKAFCPGFLFLAKNNNLTHPRVGFVFGKKHLKKATDRNKYKRIFREYFRLAQHQLPALDIIILAIKGSQQTTPEQLVKKMPLAWQNLSKKASQANSFPPNN